MKFSANLGFLWKELPLPRAIHAAHEAGFDAVEFHWPYDEPLEKVQRALTDTGLPLLSLNTRPGENFGLSALPGPEGRAAIDEALGWARALGARHVHVMAGKASDPGAHENFLDNLHHACAQAKDTGLAMLIEPINPHDVPGYFLGSLEQAIGIIDTLNTPNLRLMFDCYHIARMGGDVPVLIERHLDRIGHIQIAAVPDRGPPDHGTLDYPRLFKQLASLGWSHPLGAEYLPDGATSESLGWLENR